MVWFKTIENQCAKALRNPKKQKSYLNVIHKVQKTNIHIQKSLFQKVCVLEFSRTKAAGGVLQCWGFLHHQFGPVCVLIYTRCPWSNDLKFCEA